MIFHSTSRKPIVIVGNGARSADVGEVLKQFYEKTQIPILTTMNAVDLVQGERKLGFIGTYGNRVANMIVAECDLVIAIGARLGLRQVGSNKSNFAPNAFLIRADIDQSELSRDIKPDERKYLVDAKEFLEKLMAEDIPCYSKWNRRCFEAKEILQPYDRELGNLCIEKLSDLLPENPIVAVDIGQNQCWAAQSLTLKGDKGRILIGGSYGSMGCGLPYAIGASFAIGRSPVYCITGDGGLQMNIQELQTVSTGKLPVKIIVINNRALGKIFEIQRGSYDGRYSITSEGNGYSAPDFEKIALAYGIRARTLKDYRDLDLCKDWLYDDGPCLICIDIPEATILLPKMNWNERDMLPMLADDVIKSVNDCLRSVE